MKKGDRVSVTVWGVLRTGTVATIGRGKIIWVRMDHDGATNWFHAESLTPIPFTPKTGAKCGCKKGVERDNCPQCEGTGMVIDFAAIHRAREQRQK